VVANENDNDLESALARYCADHPNAADSVEGVRRWWLADPAIPLAEVEAALDAMVRHGLLDVRRLADGTQVYFNRASRGVRD
jgi:hypothetical protein